jgi:thiamine biosynthesis lipoprotein
VRFYALVGALALHAAAASAASTTQVHWVMGTYLRITASGAGAPDAMRTCFATARRLDGVFSRYDRTSELSRLSAARSLTASPDFTDLLERSLLLGRRTGGAFDVTAGALMTLWRRDEPPTPSAIAAARATRAGVTLDGSQLGLSPGTELDFDGIAKGYAVDACVDALRAAGVLRAFVSFGESSLYALGTSPDGGPWTVDVRGLDPEVAIGTLDLRDQAVSVSSTRGASRRQRVIVDPASGQALDEARVAVVVAPSATDAEAYSKALLIWGAAGLPRLEQLPGTDGVAVSPAGVQIGSALRRVHGFTTRVAPQPLRRAEEGLS